MKYIILIIIARPSKRAVMGMSGRGGIGYVIDCSRCACDATDRCTCSRSCGGKIILSNCKISIIMNMPRYLGPAEGGPS